MLDGWMYSHQYFYNINCNHQGDRAICKEGMKMQKFCFPLSVQDSGQLYY